MTFGHEVRPLGVGVQARARAASSATREYSCAVGAISGAVGSYSNIDPFVEEYVCEKLGLTPEPLSTQVIAARPPRARTSPCSRPSPPPPSEIATEVRALQKTDTLEAEEPFAQGPEGVLGDAAQAQPDHRRARLRPRARRQGERAGGLRQRGAVARARHQPLLGRARRARRLDIALDYLLDKLEWILDGLVLYPENMMANLEKTRGLIYSSPRAARARRHRHDARGRVRDRAGATRWWCGTTSSMAAAGRASASCSRRTRTCAAGLPPSSSTRSSTRGRSSRARGVIFERLEGCGF